MRIFRVVTISLAVLCLPVAMSSQIGVDLLDYGAAHAKKGENGKSDNGKGGGNGNSKGGNSKGGGSEKAGNSANKDKSSKSTSASRGSDKSKSAGPKGLFKGIKSALGGKKVTKTKKTAKVKKAAPVRKAKPVKTVQKPKVNGSKATVAAAAAATGAIAGAHPSDMKALNSLNRNINGMMNSNDPKMEPFREFIRASVATEEAGEDLDIAKEALAMSQEAYDPFVETYNLPEDPEEAAAELDRLMTEHLEDEPESEDPLDPERIAWEEERQNLEDAANALDAVESDQMAVDEAQETYDELASNSDDAALTQAIVDSINETGAGPVTEEDIPEAMFDKVADYMGVGDAFGFIDEYAAMMEPEGGEPEDGEPEDGDDDEEDDDGEDDEVAELLIEPATE